MTKEEKETMKVSDHRRFNPDGTERSDIQADNSEKSSDNLKKADSSSSASTDSFESSDFLAEASFANLILSLAGSAQMLLGLSPNPLHGKVEKDLKQAKYSIDLLGMLSEKTKGNLKPEEDQLLQVILTDLRMRYVEETKK